MSAATASARRASTKTLSVRSRLAPIKEKPLPVSQAAAASAKRQGEQAEQGERIAAEAEPRRGGRDGHDEPATSTLAAATAGGAGRQPTSPPARRGLAPQPPQLAVGLERAGAAATLEACLPVLHEPRQRGASAIPRRAGRRQPRPPRRSPDHPHRAANSSTSTSAARYETYVPMLPLWSRLAPRREERRRRDRAVDPLLDQVRHVAAIGDLLDDARLAAHGDLALRAEDASSTSRSGFVKPALVQPRAGSTSWPQAQAGAGAARRLPRRSAKAAVKATSASAIAAVGSEPVVGRSRPTCVGTALAHGATPTSEPKSSPGASPSRTHAPASARSGARSASAGSTAAATAEPAAGRAERVRRP